MSLSREVLDCTHSLYVALPARYMGACLPIYQVSIIIIKASLRTGPACAPNKKGNVGRRKTGGAGRQSVVPAARPGSTVVG
jgi:hypothetical protein